MPYGSNPIAMGWLLALQVSKPPRHSAYTAGVTDPVSDAPLDETIAQDREAAAAVRERIARDPQPPQPAGYRVLQPIGRGAFGAVWLAEQANTGRRVAIKRYDRAGADWPLMAREVEKLAALDSARNIVRLIEVGWDDPQPYFVMEHLPGGSLADRLRERAADDAPPQPLPTETAVRVAREIARGLRQAHGVGVLHCDLKPGNVLLDHPNLDEAEIRLCDFGQARLSQSQRIEESPALGTLFYMAPEQTRDDARPDARWDVYAFGAVLHQMLTGRPPHRTGEAESDLASTTRSGRLDAYRQLADRPVPRIEGIDRDLADLVSDCLQPDPALRPPNAQALLDRLDRRDRRRQRRPLVTLALLAPLAFSLIMLAVARTAIPQAVRHSEESLARQTLDGNQLSARLLAAGLQQDLEIRIAELVEQSRRPEVIAALAAADGEPSETVQSLLASMEARSQAALAATGRRPDTSWFVNDRTGVQVARVPRDVTIGGRFAWRDYFHGRGVQYAPDDLPPDLAIRERPGLSLPYRSKATGQYMVALVVPVRDGDRDVGILARTVHLYAILDAWEERLQSEGSPQERLLSLAGVDGGRLIRLLDHRWMTPAHIAEMDDDRLAELLTYPGGTETFGISADYADPIAAVDTDYDLPWLAAAAPVAGTDWVAIVQERRGPALEPVDQMRDVFVFWGTVLLGVFALLLVALWALLARTASA